MRMRWPTSPSFHDARWRTFKSRFLYLPMSDEPNPPRGIPDIRPKKFRCPYCVVGEEFHLLQASTDDKLICNNCGHMVFPSDTAFRCACSKCIKIDSSLRHRQSVRRQLEN
jgi:hypothetical protein